MKNLTKVATAWLGLLAGFLASTSAPHAAPAVVIAKIAAHPALWTVHSPTATAYLLGSVHILPPNIDWRTPEIEAAIDRSDVFIFEAPLGDAGKADAQAFIRDHGLLPADMALPSLLDTQARKDYRAALATSQVPPDSLVHLRPWLAAIVLQVASMEQKHYSPDSGVDQQIYRLALFEGKPIRTFETIPQQLAMLMPKDQSLEVAEFDAGLRQFQSEQNKLGPLVDAWAHGDAAKVSRLMNADLESVPGVKKALLDDRNDAWVVKLKSMLTEHKTFFITVGAGHLAGPHGVPVLLRTQGYRVGGP
jgi:uncharacterized protein YbaP (TraB family)